MTLNLIGVARARGGSSFDAASPPPIGNVTPNTGRFTSVGVGISAPSTGVYIFDTAPVSLRIDVQSDTASAEPQVLWTRTRASNTAVVASDSLGAFNWRGRSPSATNAGAATIRALVDGSPSGGAVPGRLEFLTGGGVSSTPTLRMTIAASGLVTVAGAFQAASIDATPIGGTTPAAVTGTTGRFNSDLTLAGAPGKIKPAADSTTALQIAQAGGTAFVNFDTTNSRLMLGDSGVPLRTLQVYTGQALFGSAEGGVNHVRILGTNGTSPEIRLFRQGSVDTIITAGSLPASLGAGFLFNSGASFTGNLAVNVDTDATTILGRARIDSRVSDRAYFSHFDMASSSQFALFQSNLGSTFLNAASGQSIVLNIAASQIAVINASQFTFELQTIAQSTDTSTASVLNASIIRHLTSGVPTTNFGVGFAFQGHSSTNTVRDMARIRSTWTTATDASRVSNLILSVYNVAAETDVLTLAPQGVGVRTTPLNNNAVLQLPNALYLGFKDAAGTGIAGWMQTDSSNRFLMFTNGFSTAVRIDGSTVELQANGGRGNVVIGDARNIQLGTTTGTKIGTATSQKLALWNATPDVQPTNAIAAAAFVANTSGTLNDSATYGSYTIGQIVAALKRFGLLA